MLDTTRQGVRGMVGQGARGGRRGHQERAGRGEGGDTNRESEHWQWQWRRQRRRWGGVGECGGQGMREEGEEEELDREGEGKEGEIVKGAEGEGWETNE